MWSAHDFPFGRWRHRAFGGCQCRGRTAGPRFRYVLRPLLTIIAPLPFERTLDFGQHLRLDQEPLQLVTAPAPAETHYHGVFFAFGFGAARQQRIACAEKDEIVEPRAFQAGRTRSLHKEKIAAVPASVTLPGVVKRLDHEQFGWVVRFFRQALALGLRKLRRTPMRMA
jgi:hypothetical protein